MVKLKKISAYICLSVIFTVCGFSAQSFTARLNSYADNSVLSNDSWIRFRISETGVYKISYTQLKNMGFSNPSSVHIYGYGGALLSEKLDSANYLDDLPEVPVYQGDSYILFYAQGTRSWHYSTKSDSLPYIFTQNTYSDYGNYFLHASSKAVKSLQIKSAVTDSVTNVVNSYSDYKLFEPEEVNIGSTSTIWYGDAITKSGTNNYNCSFNNVILSETAQAFAIVSANSSSSSSFSLSGLGDTVTRSFSYLFSEGNELGRVGSLKLSSLPQTGNNFTFKLTYSSSSSSAIGYLYYLTVLAKCRLSLSNSYLPFRNLDCIGSGKVTEFHLANPSSETQIWDVTNPYNISLVPFSVVDDSLRFKVRTSILTEFVALNPSGSNFLSIDSFWTVANQNLHALSDVDMVIVAPDKFLSQAQSLASLHQSYDNLSVVTVTPQQIYNEFSSGTPDPTAIRSFMKMLYDKSLAKGGAVPRYLLLFGDGCYDNRGKSLSSSMTPLNLIPAYQQSKFGYYTYYNQSYEDYYGFLSDNPSSFSWTSNSLQIAVGRIPVSTVAEASQMVEKIKSYLSTDQLGAWRNKYSVICDDNELASRSSYHLFLGYGEACSKFVYKQDSSVLVKKIYYDAYTRSTESTGNRYPEVESLILDQFNSGSVLINYIGHSGFNNWSTEKTFTRNQATSLLNSKLGIVFSASCEFSRFDNYNTSAAEALILNSNGGAIATIATPRLAFANENQYFNLDFLQAFYNSTQDQTIGDVVLAAKNLSTREARLSFVLLGDPAIKVARPSGSVVTDSVLLVNNETLSKADTIHALSHIRVFGHIAENGSFSASFAGKVNITVYDKVQTLRTKGNAFDTLAPYLDYPNILFSGTALVSSGSFSFDMILPKDISYNYGYGRMVFYASDETRGVDAKGSYQGLLIGGSRDSVEWESVGPSISLYLNNVSFRSGDVVNDSPVFYADVSDENGINSAGAGIGHDISLSLNGGTPVSLNSYFTYSLGSCTAGSVAYQLSDLEEGDYTLSFKVWDLLNNSSSKSISFTVDGNKQPSVLSISAYPNPAVSSVTVTTSYDRPSVPINYRIKVFNSMGIQVYAESGVSDSDDGQLVTSWNLTSSTGSPVSPGIYIYRVEICTEGQDYVGSSQKIVTIAQ